MSLPMLGSFGQVEIASVGKIEGLSELTNKCLNAEDMGRSYESSYSLPSRHNCHTRGHEAYRREEGGELYRALRDWRRIYHVLRIGVQDLIRRMTDMFSAS